MGNSDKNRLHWNGEAMQVCGLTLYPITLEHYGEWTMCKRALTLRQSTLPAAYAVMPYLSALYAMDRAYKTPLIKQTMLLLALALQKPDAQFEAYAMAENNDQFAFIRMTDADGTITDITPNDYPAIREAIARQNGEELPDESENPELVEAEADILAARSSHLEWDADKLAASVAYQYRIRKNELRTWSIREFEEARNAIDRDKNHLILGLAERMPMVRFVKGNPVPSWCLDRKNDGTAALESMSDFMNRTGVGGNTMPVQG